VNFRAFISNFRYRRQLKEDLDRSRSIKPPANPSQQHIDDLIAQLLNERTAWNARQELLLIGPAIAPSLISALQDPRYLRANWEKFSRMPSPLEAVLGLLTTQADDSILTVLLPLVNSPTVEVRKKVALHLSNMGLAVSIPALSKLLSDEDGYVRSFTRIGIHRAVTEGCADAEFRLEAYRLLLLQCDQDWGRATNKAAETMIAIDQARAVGDLADERLMNLANKNCHRILDACNQSNLLLPEGIVRRLLEATLPRVVGERCYPYQYVAAAALQALALNKAGGIREISESLLDHENKVVNQAAAKAIAVLACGLDPNSFVFDRVKHKGFNGLSREQRIVYCALVFDAEVCSGGLMQFFCNSSGAHSVETLESLSELGHKEAYAALDTAMKCVGPLAREADQEMRLTGFEGRFDELRSAFDPLEKAYYATSFQLRQAWHLYAAGHAQHFRD
jgi:HEAT repeat protein